MNLRLIGDLDLIAAIGKVAENQDRNKWTQSVNHIIMRCIAGNDAIQIQ
jgi:hypothetical protein